MDNESEVIKQQMEETRTSLTDKLEALEQQVVGTVQSATSAVTDTVENVKEAVQDSVASVKESVHETVETVKDTFDLNRLMDRHPWAVLGGSVTVGYLAGCLLRKLETDRSRAADWSYPPASTAYRPSAAEPGDGMRGRRFTEEALARSAAPEPSGPGFLSELGDRFAPEISKLKGLAIGTLLGVVRDMIGEVAPGTMKPQLAEVVNNITTKLGGEPVQGPVFKGPSESASRMEDESRVGCDPEGRGRALGATH